jgi:hypothetical protein
MTIQVKNIYLLLAASALRRLAAQRVQVRMPLQMSGGEAARQERDILEFLQTIADEDLPQLIDNSAQLLSAIANGFDRADQTSAAQFREGSS